jgi:hypothetical protein
MEYESYSFDEAQKVHEDIAEAIEKLHAKISLEVGERMANWIEKTLLVTVEGQNAENLRKIHESLKSHLAGNID